MRGLLAVGDAVWSMPIADRIASPLVANVKTFKVDFQISDGKIVLPENASQLRKILRFVDEDYYYESPLTQTQYVPNSKRVAD